MARSQIEDEHWGEFTVRLVRRDNGRFDGIVYRKHEDKVARVTGDLDETEVDVRERLKKMALRQNPDWIGYDGAMAFFRNQFRKGFQDDDYLKMERNYKLAAKQKLDELVPLDAALEGDGLAELALRVFQGTNLLSPFELMKVKDVLSGRQGDSFVQGAAAFAAGDMEAGLRSMVSAARPCEAAKWTVVTYLPFLWKPDVHMFLKPEVTKLFATRVGHEFALSYRADLDLDVYRCLLDLVAHTNEAISDLRPLDHVDVQSFVWVVGEYPSPQASTD